MANSHVQGLSLRTQVHVMTLGRTTAGINKAEDAGRKDAQIGFVDALRRPSRPNRRSSMHVAAGGVPFTFGW